MDKKQLYELAEDFLRPLISGARLDLRGVASTKNHALVAFADPCTIVFKADKSDDYRLVLRRSQPFEKKSAATVTEYDVVKAFAYVVKNMENGLKSWYKADLRATFPRRVVARAICDKRRNVEAVLEAIDQLAQWAGQQYEGKPIPAAIGFIPSGDSGAVSLHEMCRESFSSVVSNGFDTLLTCNFNGEILGYEPLNLTLKTAPKFAPYRLGAVAQWAHSGRIALVLNRAGEILVFRNQQLRFARRGGQWHFLTHNPVIIQMGHPENYDVRHAVYETCLDASFARTGACIGIVTSTHNKDWHKKVVSVDDRITPAQSIKAKVIAPILTGNKFQDLDRRLRQELVAIDGATLVDHTGEVLAVGAILKIPGGSTGGGRLAAAKALSSCGTGIKVSQDGRIVGFHGVDKEPKFMVM